MTHCLFVRHFLPSDIFREHRIEYTDENVSACFASGDDREDALAKLARRLGADSARVVRDDLGGPIGMSLSAPPKTMLVELTYS